MGCLFWQEHPHRFENNRRDSLFGDAWWFCQCSISKIILISTELATNKQVKIDPITNADHFHTNRYTHTMDSKMPDVFFLVLRECLITFVWVLVTVRNLNNNALFDVLSETQCKMSILLLVIIECRNKIECRRLIGFGRFSSAKVIDK